MPYVIPVVGGRLARGVTDDKTSDLPGSGAQGLPYLQGAGVTTSNRLYNRLYPIFSVSLLLPPPDSPLVTLA